MRKIRALVTVGVLAAAALTVTPIAASGAQRGSCPPRGALFCEDFEAQPVGGASSLNWGIDTRHGTLTVERAGRVGKVLRVHTEANGMAFLKVVDFSAPNNTFYGRFRVKVDAFPTAPDWAHFTLVEATGSGSKEVVRPFGGQYAPSVTPAGSFWGVGADGGPTGDWTNWRESAPTVADRWQCVEFQWYAPDNRITVWLDGVPQPDLTVSTANHGGAATDFVLPTVDTIKIGWQLYQGNPSPDHYDMWLDDIAFTSNRLGCGGAK